MERLGGGARFRQTNIPRWGSIGKLDVHNNAAAKGVTLPYWAPPAPPGLFFFSVMSAMFSIRAFRNASMTSMIAE